MNKNSFIAALKMQNFDITKYVSHTVLIQNISLSKINCLHISITENTNKSIIIEISRIFSPKTKTYYDLNTAYKIILNEM